MGLLFRGIKGNTPYSQNLDKIGWSATLAGVANNGVCTHPGLVRDYQRKLGCLMYLANSTRPGYSLRNQHALS